MVRTWNNYIIDLEKMIEAEEDESSLKDLHILEKQVLCARTVCQMLQAKGRTIPESVVTYTSQVHLLSMDPVAPNPFPAHLVKLMYGSQSEDAWPACVFWKRLEDEVVRPGIQAATDAGVEEFQMSVVTGKVILIAQADSLD